MAEFEYKALARSGEVVTGQISSDSRQGAIDVLRRRGMAPLQVMDGTTTRKSWLSRLDLRRRRKAGDKDLMLFTREFAILLRAGLPVDRALSMLDRILEEGPMRGVPGELLKAIQSGSSLAAGLQSRPETFPAFYVGMIKAGETGGVLVEVLNRLSTMLERREALKASVRSALTYPLLVLILTGLSLVVLLVYVVPEFRPMFEETGVAPPLPTRVVLAVSDAVTEWGWLLLAGLLAILLAIRSLGLRADTSRRFDAWLLRVPVIGGILRRIETARFCRSLGTLRANGVVLVEAVGISAGTLQNRAFADAVRQISGPLSRGEGLAAPMRKTGLFPPLALQLIEVGEESGELHQMLLQVADIHDTEVEREVQKALALLAPAVTVLLGLIIAFIVGSMLGAILGSYELAV
ncbi:type II secretion system F family protein [Marimonas arenosa]|uniref:Type II secretion system F family protein n=1 Tax=Marimonas arenosa TaxID=1795305 RepID=A0AAE3WFQ5_9RHOB|nr:type II secretion system F family protein [Marimonas arenosa]MDQ2090857.1 type II secretion system F family protein [Marimonas arenosa]